MPTSNFSKGIAYLNFTRHLWKPVLLLLLDTFSWGHSLRLLPLLWKFCMSKLKLILNLSFFSRVKTSWQVQNNEAVHTVINKISSKKRASSVWTFDFSTLYTNIPHDKLKHVMKEVIDFGFKDRQGESLQLLNMVQHEWLRLTSKTFRLIKSL